MRYLPVVLIYIHIYTQERHCCYFSSILLFTIIAPVIPGNGPNFSHIKREKRRKKGLLRALRGYQLPHQTYRDNCSAYTIIPQYTSLDIAPRAQLRIQTHKTDNLKYYACSSPTIHKFPRFLSLTKLHKQN
jgi:hypothetical protein